MKKIATILGAVALALASPTRAAGGGAERPAPALKQPLMAWQVWLSSGARVLPGTMPPAAAAADGLRAVSARGAQAWIHFALRSSAKVSSLSLTPSPLSNGGGGVIPASAIDAMVVRPWYQDANGWFSGERAPGDPVPVPELLLHDDSLVSSDDASRANVIRTAGGGSATIHPTRAGSGAGVVADDDAPSLLPFPIEANATRHVALAVSVPAGTPPGLYRGAVAAAGDGAPLGEIPILLRVIDFTLGPATSRFSGRVSLDGREVPSGASPAAVSTSPEPFQLVYFPPEGCTTGTAIAFLSGFGLDAPALPPALAPKAQALLGRTPGTLWVAPPLALAMEPGGVADEKALLADALSAKASGAPRVNFFVPARASGSGLARDRAAMLKIDGLGGVSVWAVSSPATYTNSADVIAAAFQYGLPPDKIGVGRPTLSPNSYGGFEETDTRIIENWHAIGTPCYLVVTASAAVENPSFWRRAVGVQPFFLGYDGVILPRIADEAAPWGDNPGGPSRSRTFAYPSRTRFIPTLALAGIADGATDVRYLSAVRRLAYAVRFPKPPDVMADVEARKALQWMQNIDPRRCDMDAVRLECIAWIERLSAVLKTIGRQPDSTVDAH